MLLNKFTSWFERHLLSIILISSLVISLVSFFYYLQLDLITAYGDSRGHLNIARRVVDSVTPGAAQFGGYWMPFLHVLMLPTIWNDFFWQTGISGSIPNMISYVISVVFIYKLVYLISKNKFSAFIASIIVMLNLNLIYMQATPMTESLFIATLILTVYFLYKWIEEKHVPDLILSALFLALCSINRYESWSTVLASSVLLIINWIHSRFSKKAEGAFVLFSMVAWLGIFGWLAWGAIIFGDPLEFMHNELSAGNQTKVAYAEVKPVGEGNLVEAVLTNFFSLKHTSGMILTALTGLGLAVYLVRRFKKIFHIKTLAIFLFLTPFMFEVLTVYVGNVPVEVPELSRLNYPSNYFNIRYALYSLPAIAFFVAVMSRKKLIQVFILCLVLLNYFLLLPYGSNKIVTLNDAGAQPATPEVKKSLEWLKNNYDGGLILSSTGGNDKHMFDTGIHQKEYITEGAYKIWDAAMQDPAKYAQWILISDKNKRDNAYRNIDKFKLKNDYKVMNENDEFMILRAKD